MKYLLFSHGFGVKKDSMGMFTDIADSFSKYKRVMFNYNKIINDGAKTIVPSYKQQAKSLQKQINLIIKKDPRANITLIAHSQGCIVAGLINSRDVSQAILLAPPWSVSPKRAKYRPNRKVLKNGVVKITKKNGEIIILSARFILGLKRANPLKVYEKLSNSIPTTIIIASKDDIVHNKEFNIPDSLSVVSVDGDHNFTGQYRKGLIKALSEYI